jgi:hypothetical protein
MVIGNTTGDRDLGNLPERRRAIYFTASGIPDAVK